MRPDNECREQLHPRGYFVATTTVGELVAAVIFLRNIASWTLLKTLLYPDRRSLISPLFGPSTWVVAVVGVLLHESNSWPNERQHHIAAARLDRCDVSDIATLAPGLVASSYKIKSFDCL